MLNSFESIAEAMRMRIECEASAKQIRSECGLANNRYFITCGSGAEIMNQDVSELIQQQIDREKVKIWRVFSIVWLQESKQAGQFLTALYLHLKFVSYKGQVFSLPFQNTHIER